MPTIMRETSIGAGALSENLFRDSVYEIAAKPQVCSVGLTAAATGSFAQLQSGAEIVAEEFAPPVATVYPVIPDNFFFNDAMAAGDRLVLRVRNPTGGAIIHRAIANITFLS